MPLNPEPQDLRALVEHSIGFFQVSASEKQLELSSRFDDAVPETWICDGLRLKQILNNLLSNAIKFTPAGSVRIELEVASRQLLVHEVDSGAGIPPERHEAVFDRDSPLAADEGSTGRSGLGLAFCKLAVTTHGGRIWIEDANPGTIVCVEIPHAR